jgi:hypothetical protein
MDDPDQRPVHCMLCDKTESASARKIDASATGRAEAAQARWRSPMIGTIPRLVSCHDTDAKHRGFYGTISYVVLEADEWRRESSHKSRSRGQQSKLRLVTCTTPLASDAHDMNDMQIFSRWITLSWSIQQISNRQHLTLATSLDDSPPINVRNIAVGAHLNSIMRCSHHRNCLLMLGK